MFWEFKKMNSAKSPPWRGVGVGKVKKFIHFFKFLIPSFRVLLVKKSITNVQQ